MKTSDLDDKDMLLMIESLCWVRGMWANTWIVAEQYPDVPFKIVASKLSRLLKRGFVTGCDCGCRGDWELTTKGREFAGITEPFRDNPSEGLMRIFGVT